MNLADVAADLSIAGLPPSTRLRFGWEIAPHGSDVVVFWARAGSAELPRRPVRLAGLGAVIDALAGRYQLALQGAHRVDGGPVCVRVSASHPPHAEGRSRGEVDRAGLRHVLNLVDD